MDGKLGKDYLKNYLIKADPLLDRYLQAKIHNSYKSGKIPGKILERFLVSCRKGKKIRGTLMTLAYELFGGKNTAAILEASIAIEIFHFAILVHDDIQDSDYLRRGLPTLHKQFEDDEKGKASLVDPAHYGMAMALNAGISGYFMALEVLMKSKFSAVGKIQAGHIFADYAIRLADGQALDIANIMKKNISEKDILTVLRLKSAEYTGVLPMLLGASLAGVSDKKRLRALKAYGLAFGWAFQIQDDVLGIYGKEDKLGKPVGSDISDGKNTLFISYVKKHGTKQQKEYIKKVLGKAKLTKSELKRTQSILKESGAYDYVINLGWKYVEKGKKEISKITKDKKMQDLLESLIVYMMERTL